jgi:hypothetical protein
MQRGAFSGPTVSAATTAACDDVAGALRLLRQAAEVEWVSVAADRYRDAVDEAYRIVLHTQSLVDAADRSARELGAAEEHARPWWS